MQNPNMKQLMKNIDLGIALIVLLSACSNPKSASPLYGEWQMIDWNGEGKPSLDISLIFKNNGEYQDSRSEDAIWNYEYIKPDSLILFHHGLYEERYKILSLSNDTLVLRLSESIIHAEENGNEIDDNYGDCTSSQYTFIRIKTEQTDSLALYRDTLIGRFNGIDIDTLICEPIDELSPLQDDLFGGKHFKWRVYTTNGTVKDLIIENSIGIDFIQEGDLNDNGTEEWGYVTQWPISQWMHYHAFTNVHGEWQHIIEPTSIWLPHLVSQDSTDYTIREEDILQPSEKSEFIKVKFSDARNIGGDFLLIDTLIQVIPQSIR